LGLYALAASRWIGRPVDRWSVYFLGSGLAVERPVAQADFKRIEARAQAALEGIVAGRFEHAGGRREDCGDCQLTLLCEAYK
jgi:hypothetical protein